MFSSAAKILKSIANPFSPSMFHAVFPPSNTGTGDLWLIVRKALTASGKGVAAKQHRKNKSFTTNWICYVSLSLCSLLLKWFVSQVYTFSTLQRTKYWKTLGGRKEGKEEEREGGRERKNMTDTLYSPPWHVYIICCWHSVQKQLWEGWCNLRCYDIRIAAKEFSQHTWRLARLQLWPDT